MKKIFNLFLLQLVFTCMYCLGQNNEQPYVYLTNYAFSKQINSIGYVKLIGGEIKSVNITGEHSAGFTIGKNHELSVRPDKLKPGNDWFDVTLTVKTSNGKFSKEFKIVKDEFIHNKVIAHRGA